MKKMYARTTVREIRQSFGRFAAIIAIVALGVGFLTGLLSTTPDMEASVDSWYQKTSMSDFDIKSTMGLTQEDAEAAAALPSVDKVTPARVTDVLVSSPDGDLLSARMYGMDLNDTCLLYTSKMLRPQDFSMGVIHRHFHTIIEFPHISRPVIIH